MAQAGFAKLDPREEHFRIPSHREGLSLFLRYLPALHEAQAHKNVVLYVHGGTFPSGLSIAHRFDGVSWRDELAASGFHCWGLDFHGFGRLSDPYPEISESAEKHPPLGRADDASRQLERAVRFICSHHRVSRISLIAHSWGSIVAGRFAGEHPRLVERLVLFGPIACRARRTDPQRLPAWRLISLKDQWDRFVADVPPGEPPVLAKHHFDEWGEAYLDIDPQSRTRLPPAVKTPSGAFQDIYDAWAGELAYDPALVRAPVSIIRGEWDGMCTEDDTKWLFNALKSSPIRRIVTISRGTTCCIWRKVATRSIAKLKPSSPAMTPLPPTSAKPHDQGRADPTCRSDCRSHAGDASSGRTAPSIFQSVSFRQGQRRNRPRSIRPKDGSPRHA